MAEDINVEAFEAASDLFSNTEISEECELGVRTLEDTKNDRILAYIQPESDILYPTDLEGKVIDPLTGQKVDLVDLTDAFILPDPKACFINELPKAASLPSNFQQAQKANLKTNFSAGKGLLQLDEDFPLSRGKFPLTRKTFPKAKKPDAQEPQSASARIRQIKSDINNDADGSETRQIFIFRSGEKPSLEIKDLEIPINEAGKQVYGDNYDDLDSDELQEQGGVVIPDNKVADVQNGKFELDSKSVSVFLNDIGLSSEFIGNLKQGNFIGSALPEINLSEFELGHIATGYVTGDFPSYIDELDGLGIYPLPNLSDLENISENFEF